MDSLLFAGTTLCHAIIPVNKLYSAIKKPSWLSTETNPSDLPRCKRYES